MFGDRKREAENQRDMAVEVAFHAILLASNGEHLLERINLLVQYIVDKNGTSYPHEYSLWVRDRILDKLRKTKGDKSYLVTGLDYKTVDQETFLEAMEITRKANGIPKTFKQARDDYFERLGNDMREKFSEWYRCNYD